MKSCISSYLLLVFLLSNLAGCSVNSKKAGISNVFLDSGKWELISVNGEDLKISDQEQPVFLEFNVTDQKVTGYTGCNRLFGAYTIKGRALTFSRIGSTKIMCSDMQVENKLLAGLRRINRYQIEGEKLLLFEGARLLAALRMSTN